MDFIISLAHFCEVHGPTSILCTQISPRSCSTCNSCSTPPSSDDLRKLSLSDTDARDHAVPAATEAPLPQSRNFQHLSSPFESPPTSPRTPGDSHHQDQYFPGPNSDADSYTYRRFGRRSFEADDEACENCSFLVPKNISERLPDGAPGSPSKDGSGRNGTPVLRTHQTVLAYGSPLHSDDESESPTTGDSSSSSPGLSRVPSCSAFSYAPSNTHPHRLDFVTTRQPNFPSAYSLLRRSCIRTLSCENLPRGSASGSLFFGDPIAGYTIAYVFRLADPRARGRRRTYALIALGGRDGWKVSQVLVAITRAFERIAGWIVSMADRVLEWEAAVAARASSASMMESSTSAPVHSAASAMPVSPPPPSAAPSASLSTGLPAQPFSPPTFSLDPYPQPLPTASSEPFSPTLSKPQSHLPGSVTAPIPRSITPVSSFLAAKKVDPDGYPRGSREVMRAKSLAEIVGRDNFFLFLHAEFCYILANLVQEFGA